MKRFIATLALVLASVVGPAAHAAAVDYFLEIDGISGESADARYRGWIDIDSFAWGLTNAGAPGGGGGGGSSRAVFSDFSWTQAIDKSTVPLFVAVASGRHFREVTFEAVRAGEDRRSFFQIVFDEAVPTSLQLTGASGGIGASASLAASRITMRYWPTDPRTGERGGVIEGVWDLSLNSPALFSGDPNVLTGLLLAGPTSVRIDGPIGAVPEPATGALMAGGLLLLWGLRRRKQR